ncbi:MAG: ribosome-associated translation inhibitor RaiA [Candidatus Dojkabacteria bacterium]
MLEKDIQISFIGMEPTEPLKEYITEKLSKKETLLEDATSIEVFFKQSRYTKGVDSDFRVDINVKLPETLIRVEEIGSDMFVNVDNAMATLGRRLTRYSDMKEIWTGEKPWKILEAETELEAIADEKEVDDYSDYTPKIARRKQMDDMSPLEEAEAIERMEMAGYDQYLFRSKKTGKISMLYRRNKGGYGLVEPSEGI